MGYKMIGFQFHITQMSEHHLDDVVAIEVATSATPWSASIFLSEINSPTHILLVAVTDGEVHPNTEKVVGFTGGQIVGDELHIHSLATSQEFRRKLVGEKLVRALIDFAQTRDARSATLEVRVGNEAARRLYEKLGFKNEGLRSKYYVDNGEDASIMWLRNFEGISS